MMIDWISRICNRTTEIGDVPEGWRSAVIVSCTRVKERGLNVRIIEVLVYLAWL